MATKKQVMKKIRSMMKDVRAEILKRSGMILDSGMVDIEAAEDDFYLPKNVMTAAMRTASLQWSPLSWDKQGQKDVRDYELV